MKNNWEIKKLGEVCDFQNGFAFKSKTFKESGIPVVRITNIQNEKLDLSKIVYIDPSDYNKDLRRYEIKQDDLLIAMSGATTGKIGIHTTDKKLLLNQRVGRFEPKSVLDKTFLFNFLITKVEESLAISAGAAQPNLSTLQIKNFQIPLPPLPEQKRIVAILDKAFSTIDKTKQNAEVNLKNAKEMFESYLQNIFENKGDDWIEKELNKITEVKDGTHDSPKYIKEGIPFVTQKNIKSYGFDIDKTKFITEIDHQKFYKRSNVSYGDILISMIGANRGMTAIVDIKDIFSIKNVGLIKESENINQYFLLYYLQSIFAKKYVKSMSNGGAQEFIGLRALRAFPIPYPKSLKEQQQIIQKLDALSAETKILETIYQQKIDDLEELKKSVLQKAFRGEL